MANNNSSEVTAKSETKESAGAAGDRTEATGIQEGWSKVIAIVKNPLGFFVLVILVLESLFGVIVYARNIDAGVRSGLLISTFAFILTLIILVTAMAIFRPESLFGTRPVTVLTSTQRNRSSLTVETIKRGKIYCATTRQWKQYAFEADEEAIKKAFGKNVTVEYQLNSTSLGNLFTREKINILHIVGHVNRDTGDMIFSDINLKTEKQILGPIDRIDADGFSALVVNADVRLVVLATCFSLLLAVRLARYTNVISPNGYVSGTEIARWSEYFYRLLAQGKPLSKAHEDAT